MVDGDAITDAAINICEVIDKDENMTGDDKAFVKNLVTTELESINYQEIKI